MSNVPDPKRNPVIVPKDESKRSGCPKCGQNTFRGRNVQGVVTFKCLCGNEWQGGLPREPFDPRQPMPPQDPLDLPSVGFRKDDKGQITEERRRVSTVPDFKKGLPIPRPGEEDV